MQLGSLETLSGPTERFLDIPRCVGHKGESKNHSVGVSIHVQRTSHAITGHIKYGALGTRTLNDRSPRHDMMMAIAVELPVHVCESHFKTLCTQCTT